MGFCKGLGVAFSFGFPIPSFPSGVRLSLLPLCAARASESFELHCMRFGFCPSARRQSCLNLICKHGDLLQGPLRTSGKKQTPKLQSAGANAPLFFRILLGFQAGSLIGKVGLGLGLGWGEIQVLVNLFTWSNLYLIGRITYPLSSYLSHDHIFLQDTQVLLPHAGAITRERFRIVLQMAFPAFCFFTRLDRKSLCHLPS